MNFITTQDNSTVSLVTAELQMEDNPIVLENKRQGTTEWQLTSPVSADTFNSNTYMAGDIDRRTNRCPALEGYAWPPSVNVGEPISFFVSTTAVSYSLTIYRMGYYNGAGGRAMPGAAFIGLTVGGSGDPQPEPEVGTGDASTWRPVRFADGSVAFTIPNDWVSGCFVAKLESADGKQSYIFFVVRDDSRASALLMQCSTSTYHAYNGWGGNSIYGYNNIDKKWRFQPGSDGAPPLTRPIQLKRPYLPSNSPAGRYGAGAGAFFTHDKGPGAATTWPQNDGNGELFSASGWEYNMVRWLEKNGYDVTYCTSMDTDQNQLVRAFHRVFLSVGHDEYWSLNAYKNVVAARDTYGTALLWFSGNTVWNTVSFETEGQMLQTGNFNPAQAQDPSISNPLVPVTDHALIGGTWNETSGQQANYRVTDSCPSWLTEGVSLQTSNVLGTLLIGYEANYLVDSYAHLVPEGYVRILSGSPEESADAILYFSPESNALVASLATIQWSWGLDDFTVEVPASNRGNRVDPGVQRFTANLINRCINAQTTTQRLGDAFNVTAMAWHLGNLYVVSNGRLWQRQSFAVAGGNEWLAVGEAYDVTAMASHNGGLYVVSNNHLWLRGAIGPNSGNAWTEAGEAYDVTAMASHNGGLYVVSNNHLWLRGAIGPNSGNAWTEAGEAYGVTAMVSHQMADAQPSLLVTSGGKLWRRGQIGQSTGNDWASIDALPGVTAMASSETNLFMVVRNELRRIAHA